MTYFSWLWIKIIKVCFEAVLYTCKCISFWGNRFGVNSLIGSHNLWGLSIGFNFDWDLERSNAASFVSQNVTCLKVKQIGMQILLWLFPKQVSCGLSHCNNPFYNEISICSPDAVQTMCLAYCISIYFMYFMCLHPVIAYWIADQ